MRTAVNVSPALASADTEATPGSVLLETLSVRDFRNLARVRLDVPRDGTWMFDGADRAVFEDVSSGSYKKNNSMVAASVLVAF